MTKFLYGLLVSLFGGGGVLLLAIDHTVAGLCLLFISLILWSFGGE